MLKPVKGNANNISSTAGSGNVTTIKSTESVNHWLKRLAKELEQQTRYLKTYKTVNGKKVAVKVNHYERLKSAHKIGGDFSVVEYCQNTIENYNNLVKKYKDGKSTTR